MHDVRECGLSKELGGLWHCCHPSIAQHNHRACYSSSVQHTHRASRPSSAQHNHANVSVSVRGQTEIHRSMRQLCFERAVYRGLLLPVCGHQLPLHCAQPRLPLLAWRGRGFMTHVTFHETLQVHEEVRTKLKHFVLPAYSRLPTYVLRCRMHDVR
jgi:hypothetical protein